MQCSLKVQPKVCRKQSSQDPASDPKLSELLPKPRRTSPLLRAKLQAKLSCRPWTFRVYYKVAAIQGSIRVTIRVAARLLQGCDKAA